MTGPTPQKTPMEIIPENPTTIVTDEESLRAHYEAQLYAQIVKQSQGHLLVNLKREMQFTGIERACRGYHHTSGPGASPRHGVEKMVRVVLLKRLYGLSLRETEEAMRLNLLYRWFAGYGLWEATPDHVTIQRFEEWVEREAPRAYFDAVLGQIYVRQPEEREAEQIGDTYGMAANAARQGRVEMWRKMGRRLEAEMWAAGLGDALAGWDEQALYGGTDEKRRWEMDAGEKWVQVARTALGAQALVERAKQALREQPRGKYPRLETALATLEKSLEDEVVIRGEEVEERQPKGAYGIGSATDPEATVRNHGKREDKKDVILGYNVQVSTTAQGLITETQARTGATPDQVGVGSLIAEQKEHHGVTPPKMIYDKAAGSGKTRHEVAEVSGGKTQLSAPLPDYAGRSKRFGPYDFELSEDGKVLTCPAGKQTHLAYRSGSGDGRIFRFQWFHCWTEKPPARWKNADMSQRCPLWEQCRSQRQGPRSQRQVFVSDYRAEMEAASAYNRTEAYRADRRLRPRIERVIAELTRYNDARRCRKRGVRSADWQAKMAATAYNIKWWMRRVSAANAPSPP